MQFRDCIQKRNTSILTPEKAQKTPEYSGSRRLSRCMEGDAEGVRHGDDERTPSPGHSPEYRAEQIGRDGDRIWYVNAAKVARGQAVTNHLPIGLQVIGKRVVPNEQAYIARELFRHYKERYSIYGAFQFIKDTSGAGQSGPEDVDTCECKVRQ